MTKIRFTPAAVAVFLAVTVLGVWINQALGFPQPQILSVVTAIVVQFVFLVILLFRRARAHVRAEWKYLSHGSGVWIVLVGSGLMSGFFLYLILFVGSARSDAAEQFKYAVGILLVFGSMFVFSGCTLLFALFRWNNEVIQERTPWLSVKELRWADVVEVGASALSGDLKLTGRDGTVLRVGSLVSGRPEFIRDIKLKLRV